MGLKLTHWEYSFILQATNFGQETREATNPFTGEKMSVHVDPGLTSEQCGAVASVIAKYKLPYETDASCYSLHLASGERVSLFMEEFGEHYPVRGLSVSVLTKKLSDLPLAFIREFVLAGQFALMSGVGEHVRLIDQTPSQTTRERFPGVQTISSLEEMRWWVTRLLGGRKVAAGF